MSFLTDLDAISWFILEETKKTIYCVIQERSFNIKKFKKCSLVVIIFKKTENKSQIKHCDNGVGVPFEVINLKNKLHNVENRILVIKGTITFDNESSQGF